AEPPALADGGCARLGAVAVLGGVAVLVPRPAAAPTRAALGVPAVAIGVVTVIAMMSGATHVHSHDDGTAAHTHGEGAATAHDHAADDEAVETGDTAAHDASAHDATHDHATTVAGSPSWPRPWDPTAPIDFSGVPGATPEQQTRAEALVAATLVDLPQFADVTTLGALGFRSIGDASTGFEHYINAASIGDDHFLDPAFPESLVFAADGDTRTLVAAMFIAKDQAVDDPALVDWGGPLMQWHVHENLCWSLGADGVPRVSGVTAADGTCPAGSVNAGGRSPMVHVWIVPHECGPFAALEGHGAGQTAGDARRVDQCVHDHASSDATAAPFEPTAPVDLSGVAGVTAEQQAYAEGLVTTTLDVLPQWADPTVAEATGFHSIGDAATGYEHYINWGWIDDDVQLDPAHPESLVYRPGPEGKQLVAAMFMLPTSVELSDVPDLGGALMQWHVHDDLCYTADPIAPKVRGLTAPDGTCRAPLVTHDEAPMIHVWIVPNECGPFAALDGIGAGSIAAGEERLCDHVHGS
ncbi:MAG: hypothetical protein ABW122_01695, partial [Ilumatobacteraceae bacterium]